MSAQPIHVSQVEQALKPASLSWGDEKAEADTQRITHGLYPMVEKVKINGFEEQVTMNMGAFNLSQIVYLDKRQAQALANLIFGREMEFGNDENPWRTATLEIVMEAEEVGVFTKHSINLILPNAPIRLVAPTPEEVAQIVGCFADYFCLSTEPAVGYLHLSVEFSTWEGGANKEDES